MTRRPDLFIVGAAKCGTTALSDYLRDHPRIYMSGIKEPHFFGADLDYYHSPGNASMEHYLRLFAGAGPEHLAVGEASVSYLYSATALTEIREFAPGARIIAMVRNPVELVPSLHSQLLYALAEDEPDLETAWRLQEDRRNGRRLPPASPVPELLQYGAVARIGGQVERLLHVFPRDQVKLLVFDDLRANAGAVYRDVLAFLGAPDDGRTTFPRSNENKVNRSRIVARVTRRPPRALLATAETLKRVARVERLGIIARVRRLNAEVASRAPVRPAFARELADYFRDDVALLGRILRRDLSAWTATPYRGSSRDPVG